MSIRKQMIGVSLGVRTTAEAVAALEQIAGVADIAELRLDFMSDYNLSNLLSDPPCPLIVTNRPKREGGLFEGSESDRLRPLREAIELGVDYIDIEHDSVSLLTEQRGRTKLIISHHDFTRIDSNLPYVAAKLQEKGGDVTKVVGMAHSVSDNRYTFNTLNDADRPTIAIAMGIVGLPSRIMALRYGHCFLTYATSGTGQKVAPGQLSVNTMHEVYQASAINSGTMVIGIIDTSLPPDTQLKSLNAALRQRGRDAVAVPFVLPESADANALLRAYANSRYGIAAWVVRSPCHQQQLGQPNILDRLQDKASSHKAVDLVLSEPEGLYGMWVGSPTTAVVALDLVAV